MSNNQQLPDDIIEHIFRHASRAEAPTLRFLSLKWHPFFTQRLFSCVYFKSSSMFKAFLRLNKACENTRLLNIGLFVKAMKIDYPTYRTRKTISSKEFIQLVKYCPNVNTLIGSRELFDNCLSSYLLAIGDSIKWSIRQLCFSSEFELKHYYKYKDSIISISELQEAPDLQFIKSFPMLKSLALPSNLPLTTMQDLMFVFDSCAHLSQFHADINIDEDIDVRTTLGLYPSLLSVHFNSHGSFISGTVIDFIITRFINLCNISFTIIPLPLCRPLFATYGQLLGFLMQTPKTSFSLEMSIEKEEEGQDFEIISNICEYFNNYVRVVSMFTNRRNFLEILVDSCYSQTVSIKTTLESSTKNRPRPDRLLDDPFVLDIHELCIESPAESTKLSRSTSFFIKRCHQLQELQLSIHLLSFYGYVYESLHTLRIHAATVDVGFFQCMSASCPNLKELYLRDVRIVRYNPDGSAYTNDRQWINLQDLRLQKLTLNVFMAFVVITTDKGCRYYFVQGAQVREITVEQAMILAGRFYNEDSYYIYCRDDVEFDANMVSR
ncbi:hypothetical protein CU097_002401 [Rhizopus azygosporus]|uniref:F-box domain-containing protein n=1 Tax=Rhizopus azygosporus TaxID=86630 RepID=A0A367K1U3_RHIAZ|nr:hypothetical protein CU097_002401 [Rhizopus azygosporus]